MDEEGIRVGLRELEKWSSGGDKKEWVGDEVLKKLLAASRDQDLREFMASIGVPRVILDCLKLNMANPDVIQRDTNVICLKLLSNLCVNCSESQLQIAKHPVLLSDIISTLQNPQSIEIHGSDFINFSIQVLCNTITLNEETQNIIWKVAFPSLFLTLVTQEAIINEKRLYTKVTSLVYNLVRQHPDRYLTLIKDGKDLMNVLLAGLAVKNSAASDESFDWVFFLIQFLFFKGALPELFLTLNSDIPKPATLEKLPYEKRLRVLSNAQANLIKVSNVILETLHESETSATSDQSVPIDTCAFIAREYLKLWQIKGSQKDMNDIYADLDETLFQYLQFLGTATAFEIPEIRDALHQVDTIPALIEMLRAFFVQDKEAMKNFDVPPLTMDEYCMRRYILRIIANMSFRHKPTQDKVREHDGIVLLLSHSNTDDKNPFLREWSIFAIRNLMEGNDENQKIIADLQVKGVITSPELDNLGIKVEVVNGKLKVSRN